MPRVDVPPVIQPPPEIPQREPSFIHRRTYPQRETAPSGTPQPFGQQGLPEELNEHGLPKRMPQGLAFQEQPRPQQQGFSELQQPREAARMPPARAEIVVPATQRQNFPDQPRQVDEEKPVFVKLEDYREVIANIEILKQKIKETEYLIDRIEEMRAQEQVELENCQGNLNKLKEKLIAIDKKLFEV